MISLNRISKSLTTGGDIDLTGYSFGFSATGKGNDCYHLLFITKNEKKDIRNGSYRRFSTYEELMSATDVRELGFSFRIGNKWSSKRYKTAKGFIKSLTEQLEISYKK